MSTAADFCRIARSFPDVDEHVHGGQPAFTVGGRRFAGLASIAQGYGNLIVNPEIQAGLVADAPEIFLPIPGGFGRMGHTHIILARANKETLHDALLTAYRLRISKNNHRKEKARR